MHSEFWSFVREHKSSSASLSLAMMYVPLMLPDIWARVCALYPFSKLATLYKIGKNMLFEGVTINTNNVIYVK